MQTEKLHRTAIRRKPGFVYTIEHNGDVYCYPVHTKYNHKPEQKLVIRSPIGKKEPGYAYFIDQDGDLARTKIVK